MLISSLLVAGACLGQAEKVCPPVVQAPSQAEMAELLLQPLISKMLSFEVDLI